MDNHPIPQDVTSFQFRLIGEMTLKQFAYLATGIAVGWIIFALPVFLLLKLPFALLFAGGGAFLAFVPLEGRSSDMMLYYFIRALFTPNQYVYRQQAPAPQTQAQQTTFLKAPQEESTPHAAQKNEKVFFQSLPSITQNVTAQIQQARTEEKEAAKQAPLPPAPQPFLAQHAPIKQQITMQETKLQEELREAKVEEKKEIDAKVGHEAHEKVLELQAQMLEMQRQKEDLEKRLLAMQQSAKPAPKAVYTPSVAPLSQQTSHVVKIPAQMAKKAGMPLVPDVPNLITGIIRDARGNILPNILIEVKDKDGNPVRAFKTNNLGQFASATPLLNGTYTLAFEDPSEKHNFDSAELVINGQIMMPIEVISVDQREKLRQELFGQPTAVPA